MRFLCPRAGLDLGHVGPVRSFEPWLSATWVTLG